MTSHRAQLEAILLDHIGLGGIDTLKDIHIRNNPSQYDRLLDALCAVEEPKLDREALWKLMSNYATWIYQRPLDQHDEWIKQFLAWARGEPREPVWCACMQWVGISDQNRSGWIEKCSGDKVVGWKFCPLCAAPRPAGG